MKKTRFTAKIAIALVLCLMTALVTCADFAKTNTYAEGTFTDVKADAWYKNDVVSAYELGFMNGTGSGKFSPDGNVTVAEAITMASRVHSINKGTKVAEKQGSKNWYDMYVDYAIANGLITKETFDNYDRNAMRYEVASLFANAMPASHFAAKNDVKDIPDIAETEEYYDELMMLYKAGVVMGSTEYGDFLAINPIKRSETAAIINRVALPENRLSKTLKEYPARNQAVYLINNKSMQRNIRGVHSYLTSGWTYEDPGSSNTEKYDFSSGNLADTSETYGITARKAITVQTSGKVVFESQVTFNNDGAKLVFEDLNKNVIFGIFAKDGKYTTLGKASSDMDAEFATGLHRFYIILDLDAKKAIVVMNGKELGTYEMADFTELASVAYMTTDEDMLTIGLVENYMYTQYAVNDTFRTAVAGEKLYGWDTTGDVVIKERKSDYDSFSAVINDKGTATKKFDAVSGKFVYETFVEVPAGQKVSLELKNGEKSAVKVQLADGKITSGAKLCREYNSTLWNLVRVEGDTNTGKALIRVNGKKEGTEVTLSEKAIDSVVIASDGTGEFWFDDIQVYNVYDYADYVPTPVPVNNDEYYLGMSICSLWREGTHAGWDYIAPYDDIQPVIGYYDEGLPEVADWEIKFLAEHGYDFEHFCWYFGNMGEDGIKEPRLGFALHDGYMNAKYSDMVKFAIMWENWSSKLTKEIFLDEIWPYWCEWYFSDSRYMSVNNKAIMTIYRHPRFIEEIGGEEEAKEVIAFMKEDIKRLGYDGLILLGTGGGSLAENKQADYIGIDGFVAYHFGSAAYNPEHQINSMNAAFDNGYTPFLPSVGVGFNDIGWDETKRVPLATAEAHKSVFEWAKNDYLPRILAHEGEEWTGKLLVANTWNEFGEGHYIFPTNLNKFGYLDAARQVISSVAGKDDKKHFDVEPTDNQKARLGYLYPARTIPMRRTRYISDDDAIAQNEVIKSWNFENEEDCKKWSSLAKTTPTKYDPVEKALTAQMLQNDAHIKMNFLEENHFNADDVRYIHVQMKTDAGYNTAMEFYYSPDEGFNWNAALRVEMLLGKNGEYIDYFIDMQGKNRWGGMIKSLRFDPMGTTGNFWIKKIELLSDKATNGYNINVKGEDFNFSPDFFKKVGDEVYVGANAGEGFYSLNNFYYEWNRWTGKLMIRTYTDHEFNFTVGSDKALVDGKEVTLNSKIELIDGVPMIPVFFIYDNAEYVYEKVDGGLKVIIKGIDVEKILESRKANKFEFNVPGDNEGWRVSGASGGVIDSGVMYFEATLNNNRYDSQIVLDKPTMKAADYNKAEIRIKPVYKDDFVDKTVVMYFSTDTEPALSEKKTARIGFEEATPDAEGYYTGIFDFSENESWKGNIKLLRFDPPNRPGEFYIDYIRFIEDPEAAAKKAAEEAARLEAEKKMEEELGLKTVASLAMDSADLFRATNIDGFTADGTLKGRSLTSDPNLTYTQKLNLNASDITAIKIKAKVPSGTQAEIFFSTDEKNFSSATRFFIVSKTDDIATYVIDTTANENWKGTIREFRFDPTMNEGLDFEVVSIEFCGEKGAAAGQTSDVVKAIKFNNPSLFRANNIDALSVEGTLKGTSSTTDPSVIYAQKLDLNASDVTSIRIKAKIPAGVQAELFFTTDEKQFSSSTRFFIVSKASGIQTYVIDTAANENWKGTIRDFRIDPVMEAGVSFEWYSVEFCGKAGEVKKEETPAKEPEKQQVTVQPSVEAVASIKFDNPSLFRAGNINGLTVDGTMKGVSASSDPNVVYTQKLNLNASEVKSIRITAKIPAGMQSEIFFANGEKHFSGSTRFFFASTTDEVKTYVIDTTKNENWKGTISELRFDPVMAEGVSFEWFSIEFCK